MRHAADAQNGRLAVLFDTDAILLAQRDAFGVKNGGGGQLAVRRHRAFPVRDDGDGPLLVDDETAGELVVDVADIDGDFRRFGFVLVEEVQQLLGAGRDRPERHFLAVDGDGGLVCALHVHHIMVLQHAGRAGRLHQVVRFDFHALLLQQTVHAHRICGHRGGLPIDGQCHGFARAHTKRQRRSQSQ